MSVINFDNIKAVIFDIDGTLYPSWKMKVLFLPATILHPKLSFAFFKTRKEIRNISDDYKNFYDKQAELIAPKIETITSIAKIKIDKHLYKSWEKYSRILKPRPYLEAVLKKLKEKNIKIYALSDLPVKNKLKYLGVEKYFEKSFCSEELGRLKPDPTPFLKVLKYINLNPENVLYVGDSERKDIVGAKNVKMKSALITKTPKSISDFDFSCYKDFLQIIN